MPRSGIGASSLGPESARLARCDAFPVIVSFLNPQPSLSLGGGNRSSCPKPDLQTWAKTDPLSDIRTMTHRPLDPRICNVGIDANAIDRDGTDRDALVNSLLALYQAGTISLILPKGVRVEIANPNTPADVQEAAPKIFTIGVVAPQATLNTEIWGRAYRLSEGARPCPDGGSGLRKLMKPLRPLRPAFATKLRPRRMSSGPRAGSGIVVQRRGHQCKP